MRRIVAYCAIAAALTFAVLSTSRAEQAAAQKSRSAKTAAAPTYGNADAMTEEELQVYEYFLASDQLEGRNFPSRGYDTASLYIASHLVQWGLKPGGSATGTKGPLQPYFMPMELVTRQVQADQSKATLTTPAQGGRGGFGGGQGGGAGQGGAANSSEPRTVSFEYGKDWVAGNPAGFGGGRGGAPEAFDVSGGLVFVGNGYVVNKTKVNPYEGLDVKGKILVIAGLPPEIAAQQAAAGRGGRGGRGAAPDAANPPETAAQPPAGARAPANPLGEECTDFLTPEQYAAKNGAVGVVTLANFQQLTAMTNPAGTGGRGGRGPALNGPNYQVVKLRQTPACPAAPSVTVGLDVINSLFQGEKLSGQQVFYAAGANAKQESFELNARKKLALKLSVRSEAGHGQNVIGILEGSDPVLKNEYIIMSAHLDHIGFSAPLADGHNVNNGADDDGSGSSALLAMAHAYAAGAAKGIRPRRSILFLWNGGEEKGLLGSQYFARFPPIDLTKVVANLNMDMIGRTKSASSNDPNQTHVLVKPGEVLLIGPDISSADLGEIIDGVNRNYQKLVFNHFYDATAPDATHDNLGPAPRGQRVFYRSDHYNFAKMGVPIAFFTTGLHEDYHRATDTPDKIDYKAMLQIAKTVAAVGWELANQSGRPKLKEKLPDDLLRDMKTAQQQGWGKITPVSAPVPGEPY